MNSTSAEVGGRVPGRNKRSPPSVPLFTRRGFADFLLQLGNTLLVVARGAGPLPLSISAFSTQLRSVSGLTPSLWPTLARVPRELPDAARRLEDHRHRTFPQLSGMLFS